MCVFCRAARYGDTAEECGEAFFLCGKSLLELARWVGYTFVYVGASLASLA